MLNILKVVIFLILCIFVAALLLGIGWADVKGYARTGVWVFALLAVASFVMNARSFAFLCTFLILPLAYIGYQL